MAVAQMAGAPSPAAADASHGKVLLNLDRQQVALKGYDPVAFHTVGRPVEGKTDLTASWQGATYRFSTAQHKAMFEADPAKYAPAYGGYCAYGVSRGYTASVDIRTAQIIDGRLILNYSLGVKETFDKDQAGYLARAEAKWPGLVEKEGKKP